MGEKRVTLHGLTWQAYQQILQALPQSRAARFTYDQGVLEMTIPLQEHEFALRLIEHFITALVTAMGMKVKTMGSTRIDREDLQRSAEPDCTYYIQHPTSTAGGRARCEFCG
ncbi:MAG: hypothetical protein NZL92_07725 [Gloeomargarita sp. SKYG116]|nr:hypothetical protein [Gloeomargarita sp. SKYG116]MDW8401570.1 hypothetical protein [Gloeomargarita sp. SKYGB_i_bin116]